MRFLPAVLIVAGGLALCVSGVAAQPQIPATFYGSVTVDGKPAADGLEVRAFVNGLDCSQPAPGERPVIRDGETSAYVLSVVHESQRPGCAQAGSSVTFTIGGRAAVQSAPWTPGPIRLDLSTGAAPPIPLPSPTGTIAAALATETAGAPVPTSATLARPTGTPPTGDVTFDKTPAPPGTIVPSGPGASPKDSDGPPVLLIGVGALVVLAAAGGATGFALSRRRRPPGA
jgi:hypothetical protein